MCAFAQVTHASWHGARSLVKAMLPSDDQAIIRCSVNYNNTCITRFMIQTGVEMMKIYIWPVSVLQIIFTHSPRTVTDIQGQVFITVAQCTRVSIHSVLFIIGQTIELMLLIPMKSMAIAKICNLITRQYDRSFKLVSSTKARYTPALCPI